MRKPDIFDSDEITHAPLPLSECALARAVKAIGDPWTLLILREMIYGVGKFDALREDLKIPGSVLSARLARLVENGIVERRSYSEAGSRPRKAYSLTESGRALYPALLALRCWAEEHLPGKKSRLRLRHSGCGEEVRTQIVCADGHHITAVTDLSLDTGDKG